MPVVPVIILGVRKDKKMDENKIRIIVLAALAILLGLLAIGLAVSNIMRTNSIYFHRQTDLDKQLIRALKSNAELLRRLKNYE